LYTAKVPFTKLTAILSPNQADVVPSKTQVDGTPAERDEIR
jgi:hypothetical protein